MFQTLKLLFNNPQIQIRYSKVRRIFRSSTFILLDLVNLNWLLSNGVNDDDRNKGGLYNGKYGGTTIAGFGAAI